MTASIPQNGYPHTHGHIVLKAVINKSYGPDMAAIGINSTFVLDGNAFVIIQADKIIKSEFTFIGKAILGSMDHFGYLAR